MDGDRQWIAERNVRQRLPHAGDRHPRRPEHQRGESAGAPVDLRDRVKAADRPAIPDESDAGLRAAHPGLVDEPGAGGAPAAARATPTDQGPDPAPCSRAHRPRTGTTQAIGAATSASLPAQGGAAGAVGTAATTTVTSAATAQAAAGRADRRQRRLGRAGHAASRRVHRHRRQARRRVEPRDEVCEISLATLIRNRRARKRGRHGRHRHHRPRQRQRHRHPRRPGLPRARDADVDAARHRDSGPQHQWDVRQRHPGGVGDPDRGRRRHHRQRRPGVQQQHPASPQRGGDTHRGAGGARSQVHRRSTANNSWTTSR